MRASGSLEVSTFTSKESNEFTQLCEFSLFCPNGTEVCAVYASILGSIHSSRLIVADFAPKYGPCDQENGMLTVTLFEKVHSLTAHRDNQQQLPSMFAEPQTIADLGDSGTAKRHVGSSFTISQLGKRKRSEVVLATDYSGVAVYDARSSTSRSLTGHSVPPGEGFVCTPVSVVVKYGGSRPQERFTYWATDCSQRTSHISGKLNKIKITCLHEAGKEVTTTSTILGTAKNPVSTLKCIDVVPSQIWNGASTTYPELLAIHQDCTIHRFSSDLQSTLMKNVLPTPASSLYSSLAYVAIVPLSEARQSVLISRDDLLSTIPTSTGVVLVCVVGDDSYNFRICYVHVDTRPTALLSLPVPGLDGYWSAKSQFYLHAKSAKLYQLRLESARPQLSIYDLSGLSLRIDASMELPGAQSFARVSQHCIVACAGDSIATCDVRWNYVQDRSSRLEKEDPSQLRLLSYFPSSGTALIIRGNSLLAYNIRDDVAADGKVSKKRRTGGLADAVGQGKHAEGASVRACGEAQQVSRVLHKRLVPSSSRTAALDIMTRFEPLLGDPNPGAYDEAMLHALQTVSSTKRGSSIGYTAQPDLVAYAISELFHLHETPNNGPSSLSVRRMAPETFRFLLTHGLLTVAQVEKSLRLVEILDSHGRLSESALVNALTKHDETLQALIFYLSSAPLLSTHELSAALLICLNTVRLLEGKAGLKTIEAADSNAGGNVDVTMTNGMDSTGAAPSDFDGEWPDPDPEEGITHNARSALGSCLTRLSLCFDKDIQLALRATMSAAEILSLVDYIRMELSSGGWLARYLDEDLQGEDDLSAQTNQVNVAAKILNCAIDSLGAATWLLGTGREVEASRSADKVAYMQAEINAALEGIENSAFLEQILHEVLLYAKTAEDAEKGNANPEIVQVPVGVDGKEVQMLPLGMKKDKISRTRIASGGKEVTRTARDIGRLESRKVPEYSFERVMI